MRCSAKIGIRERPCLFLIIAEEYGCEWCVAFLWLHAMLMCDSRRVLAAEVGHNGHGLIGDGIDEAALPAMPSNDPVNVSSSFSSF